MSKITSLEHVRKRAEQVARRAAMTPEARTEALEVDVSRLIDVVMDLEDRLWSQERHLRKLVRLLREARVPLESSVAEPASASEDK